MRLSPNDGTLRLNDDDDYLFLNDEVAVPMIIVNL